MFTKKKVWSKYFTSATLDTLVTLVTLYTNYYLPTFPSLLM